MGVGQRTVRSVAILLLLVTIGSAALWLRDDARRDRDERIHGLVSEAQTSAEDTAGYTGRQGLAWIRRAAASIGPDPTVSELEAYARASGFSAATVLDPTDRVVASWGPPTERRDHLLAVRRSRELGGPRVAGAEDADRAAHISVALPFHPDRHLAVSVDVRETAVEWYLAGLAGELGAEVALVTDTGLPVLMHAPDGRPLTPADRSLVDLPAAGETLHRDGDVVAGAAVVGTPWHLRIAVPEERLFRADPAASRLPWILVGLIALSGVGAVGLVLRLDTVRRRAGRVQAEYRRTVDQLQEGVIRTSLAGEVQMANRAALRILGCDHVGELQGRVAGDLLSLLRPWDAAEFRRRLAEDGAVSALKVELRDDVRAGREVSHLALSAQYVLDEAGRRCAVEGLVVDVTERHRDEQELARRDRILRSAAGAASTLLREPAWEQGIGPALAAVGAGAGVERVFLFGVTSEGDDVVADYLHEWVAAGIPAAIDAPEMHHIPIRATGFGRWVDVLSTGGMITGDAASFPASEQALLSAVSARSLLAVPVMTRDGWWGFIGFAQVTGERAFSAAEADALRVAAEVIGAAVDRSIDHERLRDAVSEQARAAAELRAAGQVRDDFLSMVSHELRTPLTPILGFSHLLGREGLPPAHRERGLAAIRRNARRMLGLVDDLLVYSRASAGRVGAIPGAVDLAATVRGVVADLDLGAHVVVVDDGHLAGWVDESHLGHIVTNLVTNALKYGDGRATVEIVPSGGEHVVLRVRDQGPGVPAAFVPHLFDRFTQASTGDRRTASGTGLGLAIVRLLAEANGAEVSYRPNVPTGACFEVRMPAAVAGERAVRLPVHAGVR